MTLLTVEEFRAFVSTALEDDPLLILLGAAEQEIVRAAGPGGSTVELFGGGSRLISLASAADSITSITETIQNSVTTLDPTDYLIHPGGYTLERLQTGTNGRWRWWGRVTVTYVPADDDALREVVQRDLVTLMLNFQPGVTSETVGSWTRQLAGNAIWNQSEERDAILARLSAHPLMIVV